MTQSWVSPDVRDAIVDFTTYWSQQTTIQIADFIQLLGISPSKYYNWKQRYGKVNEHNCMVPRDFWLEPWEKQAIIDYYHLHPTEGYRRLTYMMLDNNIVAVSPTSVYRVLKEAGCMKKWSGSKSKGGSGFEQPFLIHEHWHMDISYINICGTFYYLCSVLDGASRYIVHWEIREQMQEKDVEIILKRALEKYPEEKPRVISDNGPQFIARDFKEFIRINGLTHVRTSPFHPQSNGKLERWHQSLKRECIRPKTPLSLEEARDLVGDFVLYYNTVRLHSALGYVTPIDKLEGRDNFVFKERDSKLERAREERKARRHAARNASNTQDNDFDKNQTMLTERSETVTTALSDEAEAGSAGGQPAEE